MERPGPLRQYAYERARRQVLAQRDIRYCYYKGKFDDGWNAHAPPPEHADLSGYRRIEHELLLAHLNSSPDQS